MKFAKTEGNVSYINIIYRKLTQNIFVNVKISHMENIAKKSFV